MAMRADAEACCCIAVVQATGERPRQYRWLAIWLLSRVAVGLVVTAGALVGDVDRALRASDPAKWWLYRFAHWDSHLYAAIAERGYVAEGPASNYNAFFPGLPAIMKVWTAATGTDGRWGALIVVTVTGAVAAVLVGALATDVTGRGQVGTGAVVLFACSPLTVFFSVAYTEAIFVCLSLGAWLLARRQHWLWAGVLAGGACALRLNGLFLLAGLMVLYFVRERPDKTLRMKASAAALMIGPVFVAYWAFWLHGLTGHWDTWTRAQEKGWGRKAAWPWVGLEDGIGNLAAAESWHLTASRRLDLVAVLVALIVPVYFATRRNWPLAALLGLNAVPILFSSILDSGARYLLVWFPIYVLAASCLATHTRTRHAIVTISSLLALTLAYCWSQQYWLA